MAKRKLRRNKKGSLFDIVLIAFVLTFFAIAVLFGTKVAKEVQSKIAEMPIYQTESPETITETARAINNYENTVNTSFLFLALFLGMVTIALAAMVRIHPIFIIFFLIGLIAVIFLSGVFSNIYQTAAESSQLAPIAADYNMMHQIMKWLPMIVGIFGILLMIAMYKLWSMQ